MTLREYEVSSTYKVIGTAYVLARSAAEAIEKAKDLSADDPVQFYFDEPHAETKMRARRTATTEDGMDPTPVERVERPLSADRAYDRLHGVDGYTQAETSAEAGGGTMTLAEFLLSRIAEDKKFFATYSVEEEHRAFLLAECEAKRRIVERFQQEWDDVPERGEPGDDWKAMALEEAVQILASIYADHSDFREEWQP